MATVSISGTVRELLKANPSLSADEVIAKTKARGVAASADSIRVVVHKVRSELKKGGTGAPAVKPATPAAKSAAAMKPAAPAAKVPAPATNGAAGDGLNHVFTNVTRVNQVVGLCGSIDHARQAAEAVRACGSVDAFLQHLDLVAGIRVPQKA